MTKRASGILLHPTSLPGNWGIGDLGPSARDFVEWLASAAQSLWQVLPLNPVGFGGSPYSTPSSFAGNPLLISPELLAAQDLLPASISLEPWSAPADPVDHQRVSALKIALLRRSWEHVSAALPSALATELGEFEHGSAQGSWLADWALFAALDREQAGSCWTSWPEELRRRDPAALAAARERLRDEVGFEIYLQFLFERQWASLQARARELEVSILGDLPIYVAHHSADVWANQDLFDLDDDGAPRTVGGVPPDFFSADGQRWGTPLYRWDRMRASGFGWWVDRIATALGRVDYLRLDHFRGFAGYWQIPAAAETAAEGEWRPGPGREFFASLERKLGDLPLVAEDLGVITPDVVELRRGLGLPGMKVLQFGFGEPGSDHLPHRHERDNVVYTGTHDNDTARGWFENLTPETAGEVLEYLGGAPEDVPWSLVRAAMTSVADWAVIPVQDLVGLGNEARMNRPGEAGGNWSWRCDPKYFDSDLAARLGRLTVSSGRARQS